MVSEKIQILAFVCVCFRIVKSSECSGNSTVYTNANTTTYIGCEIQNWKGETCQAYRGIAFARAPIGDLRFKDPIPARNDFDIVDARSDGKDCPSIFTDNASEDCLFLNVYFKNKRETNNLLPVIVFIHPGGFYGGTGASTFLGPEYILENDVVLITFNYRLASLGFLNLGTPDIPGNAGLKDQVIALRWVHNNIRYFGGDPKNVALMGYSAGAMSVFLHLISPMSQNLFHKAIIMSGSLPPQTIIPLHNQINLAKTQASILGCKVSMPNDVLQCLNKLSGLDIAKTLRKMFPFGKDNPIFLWLPIIEEDYGQERFLTEDPYTALKAGRFTKVPILIGFTNGEFCTSAHEIISNNELLNKINTQFEKLAPICFMFSSNKHEIDITNEIKSYYFQNNVIDESQFKGLCDLFSDSIIRFGAAKLAELTSKYVKVYPYRFSYRGKFSNLQDSKYKFAEHMDDLMYLFRMPLSKFSPMDSEAAIVQLMVNFFTNFVIDGKPKEGFEYNDNKFAEIHSSVDVINGSFFENFSFWNNATKL